MVRFILSTIVQFVFLWERLPNQQINFKITKRGEKREYVKEMNEIDQFLRSSDDQYSFKRIIDKNISSDNRLDISEILVLASKFGRKNCCILLIENYNADVNHQNKDGYSPLHNSFYFGYEDLTFLLLNCGANIHITNHFGETPIDAGKVSKQFHLIQKYEQFLSSNVRNSQQNVKSDLNRYLTPRARAIEIASNNFPLEEGEVDEKSEQNIINDKNIYETLLKKLIFESKFYELYIESVDGHDSDQTLVGQSFKCMAEPKRIEDEPKRGSAQDSVPSSRMVFYYIGRSRNNDLNLSDMSISKKHCVMMFSLPSQSALSDLNLNKAEVSGFHIRDLGSKYGTFVNKRRLQTPCPNDPSSLQFHSLKHGDWLRLGRIKCQFRKVLPCTSFSKSFIPSTPTPIPAGLDSMESTSDKSLQNRSYAFQDPSHKFSSSLDHSARWKRKRKEPSSAQLTYQVPSGRSGPNPSLSGHQGTYNNPSPLCEDEIQSSVEQYNKVGLEMYRKYGYSTSDAAADHLVKNTQLLVDKLEKVQKIGKDRTGLGFAVVKERQTSVFAPQITPMGSFSAAQGLASGFPNHPPIPTAPIDNEKERIRQKTMQRYYQRDTMLDG